MARVGATRTSTAVCFPSSHRFCAHLPVCDSHFSQFPVRNLLSASPRIAPSVVPLPFDSSRTTSHPTTARLSRCISLLPSSFRAGWMAGFFWTHLARLKSVFGVCRNRRSTFHVYFRIIQPRIVVPTVLRNSESVFVLVSARFLLTPSVPLSCNNRLLMPGSSPKYVILFPCRD